MLELYPEAVTTQPGKYHFEVIMRELNVYFSNWKSQITIQPVPAMEPPEPTSEQSDSNFDYLVDLNKDSDSIRELQSSLMRRTEPAVKQKLQVCEISH